MIVRLLLIVIAWAGHTFATEPPYSDPPNDPVRFCVEAPDRPAGSLDCYLLADVPDGSTVVWSGRESRLIDDPRPMKSTNEAKEN